MLSARDYLKMLKEYEEAAADLYDTLKSRSLFRKTAWRNLSEEGDTRIETINRIVSLIDEDKNAVSLRSFVGMDAVEAKNFVLNVQNLLDARKISRRDAIRRITDIEKNVMEADFYGKLHSDNVEVREIINKLRHGMSGKISVLNVEKKKWF